MVGRVVGSQSLLAVDVLHEVAPAYWLSVGCFRNQVLAASCYNFARPHRALKFGREIRTPAMQAGLATRRLTLRESLVPRGHPYQY